MGLCMVQLTVRIDDELENRLKNLARHEDKTTSDVVRALVKEYVQDRDRSTFLENLWERMRENAEDVDRMINRVRSQTR